MKTKGKFVAVTFGKDKKDEKKKKKERETNPEKMTPKERLQWTKVNLQWKESMEFLFRHLAIQTFRFNLFYVRDLTHFAKAMSVGDELRSQRKLKKSEQPRISSLKTMLDTADQLEATQQAAEAAKLRELADMSGKIRTWGLMAADLQKLVRAWIVLEDEDSDKMSALVDGIQSYTNRTCDFGRSKFVYRIDLSEFTEMEKEYLTWPVAVRTALFNGSQFMQMCTELTGVPLLEPDPTYLLKNMQAEEFVMAINIDDALHGRNTEEDQQMAMLLGPSSASAANKSSGMTWRKPNIRDDLEPEIFQAIGLRSLLLQLPTETATEPKSKKSKKKK